MKKLYSFLFGSFLLIFLLTYSCTNSQSRFSKNKHGEIEFQNPDIKIRIDSLLNLEFHFRNFDTKINTTELDDYYKPSHFPFINGNAITDFKLDYERIKAETIENEFGKGEKLTITGTYQADSELMLEKTLNIELYDRYPNAAVIYASYKNTGSHDIKIDKIVSDYLILDASLANPENKSWDFWTYQGASIAWGIDYIFQITENYKGKNWMGVQTDTKTGGGTPLIDLWNEKCGLAIAQIETKPQLISMPMEVLEDKKVHVSLEKEKDFTLNPGAEIKCIRTAVIVHELDYFNPLRTYSSIMADQGVKQPTPSDDAHEAIWCGWGYLTDFTLDDIYGTLPKLKELGIKWVVIDDRWWDKYGDWNIRDYTFPKGEAQVKEFVDSLHNQGFKVKIWWAPTPVQPDEFPNWGGSVDPGMAQIAKDHPDWLIMDEEGNYPRDCRDMYQFCPSVPEVQEYMKELTTRFVGKWGFDGHKLDAYYVVPPCYNPAHNHKHPEESYQDLPKLLQAIYETSKSIKPESVTEICNCGTTQDFYQSVFIDQSVVSDPTSVEQSRRRVKAMKALWGSNAPVYTDHVEHIRIDVDMNDKSNTAKVGQDFATSMGTGGVIGTKFTWPEGPENMQLTGEREEYWTKWVNLYNEKMLSKGNYLNLYDVIYDKPETHVIQKGDTLYYAFYAKDWNGEIELRGLSSGRYQVYDYENQADLGEILGPDVKINVVFRKHLLIECKPKKD